MERVKYTVLFLLLFIASSNINVVGLIIPEELPSVLSVIYSNIPPIKNGFDTRFGIGFRLGQHADVQLVTEIGPQIETQPLGESSERRRFASELTEKEASKLQELRKYQLEEEQEAEKFAENKAEPEPDTWLTKWHKSTMENLKLVENPEEVTAPTINVMEQLKKIFKIQK